MSKLNALHTLPAKIAPASGFFARGKALVSFYKTGISNVWHNRSLARDIRSKYGVASSLDLARSIIENTHLASIEGKVLKNPASQSLSVTRDELLTLFRSEKDFRKLPLFVAVFAVCFEFTPAVLWGFPRIAPSTCWSVSFNKKLQKTFTADIHKLHNISTVLDGSESVNRLPDNVLRQLTSALDFGHQYRFLPRSLVMQRVNTHMLMVRADDDVLRENIANLGDIIPEELDRALMARCLPLDGGLHALRAWLEEFVEPMDAGYFCLSKSYTLQR